MGKEYLLEHCVLQYNDDSQKKAFAYYCSEMLRSANNNISQALGGKSFPKSWKEILEYKPETRTAEEIKRGILAKLHSMGE